MKLRLLALRETLLTSIWFIPTLLCTACLSLALLLLWLEHHFNTLIPAIRALDVPVASARQVLGVIAGAVLSVGGVVFSITMVALTLTSGQYGPKLIRQFLSDHDSKISLGLFMGTSLYCLVTLAGLGDDDHPSITVVTGLLLTIAALVGFIRFIHRSATDMQADKIIERICGELGDIFEHLPREDHFRNRSDDTLDWRREARGRRPLLIAADTTGYVQAIDYPAVVRWCVERDCVCQLRVRAGDFLLRGECFARLYGRDLEPGADDLKSLMQCISTGPMRTPVQDPEYPITQLNQLIARAMSPGINDPGTAITCVDWFTMALAVIVDRRLPGKVFHSADGRPRVLARLLDFTSILDAFYVPLRQFARADVQVLLATYESLIRLAEVTTLQDRLRQLARHGLDLQYAMRQGNFLDSDLRALRQRQVKLASLTGRLADNAADPVNP